MNIKQRKRCVPEEFVCTKYIEYTMTDTDMDHYPDARDMMNKLHDTCWEKLDYHSLPNASLDDIAKLTLDPRSSWLGAAFEKEDGKWLLGDFSLRNPNTGNMRNRMEILYFNSYYTIINQKLKYEAHDIKLDMRAFLSKTHPFKLLPERCPGYMPTLEQLAYKKLPQDDLKYLKSNENTVHHPHNLNRPFYTAGKSKRKTKRRKSG